MEKMNNSVDRDKLIEWIDEKLAEAKFLEAEYAQKYFSQIKAHVVSLPSNTESREVQLLTDFKNWLKEKRYALVNDDMVEVYLEDRKK